MGTHQAIQEEARTSITDFLRNAGLDYDLVELQVEEIAEPKVLVIATTPSLSFLLRRYRSRLRVVMFENTPRIEERVRAHGRRTGANLLGVEAAHMRASRLASVLVPEWAMDENEYVFAQEPNSVHWLSARGGDLCGGARVELGKVEPEGPVFAHERAVSVSVDTLDGALLSFRWNVDDDREVTSRSGTVTEQEARAKAMAVALAIHGVDMGAHETTATKGFAGVTKLPGVERQRRAAAPYELRFAWRVRALSVTNGAHVQDLFVDIDAQTGEVLNLGWLKPLRPPGQ